MKVILTFLLAFSCVTIARSGNNYNSTNRLTAVWEGSSYVLATTSYGLFRASPTEKKWIRLTPPESMPLQGNFGHVPATVDYILFVASGADSKKVSGIYISHDKGISWELLSKDYKFTSAYVHESGKIYAVASNKILVSDDQGKTWRDISAKTGGLQLLKIFPDPDHTNLVCLLGNGIRNYILQAQDETYQWAWTREWQWKTDKMDDARFFDSGYATTWAAYMHFATLDNYFEYDFGGATETCAFRLLTDKKVYVFQKNDPKPIQTKIVLYPEELKIRLVDFNQSPEVYHASIKTPDTNYFPRPLNPLSELIEAARSGTQKSPPDKPQRTRTDFKVVELTSVAPYQKMINLDDLFEFKQSGKYTVQLIYDSMGIADRGHEEWPGLFKSQPFELLIK